MARSTGNPLGDVLASAAKKYNISIGPMDSITSDALPLTTGNLAIDYAIGIGGIPMGRSVEMFGPPSSGKTTTALQVAERLQRVIMGEGDGERGITSDDAIIYFDYEQAMDKSYAQALGLDVNHKSFQFAQPDSLEDGANLALDLAKTGFVRLMIFDSVAAMNPSSKAEAEIGKSLPAVQAKLMKDFGVNLNTVLAKNNCTAIFINHLMEKMDMGMRRPGMPPPTTTPGGAALKFFASVRIEYKQIRQNKATVIDPLTREEMQVPTSTDTKVKVVKNKVAPPFREATVRVRYGRGFDNFWTALQVMLANKKVMYQTGRYYWHNVEDVGLAPEWMDREKTGTHRPVIHGENKVFAMGDEHPEWRDGVIALAEQVAKENADSLSRVVPTNVEDEEQDLDDLPVGA